MVKEFLNFIYDFKQKRIRGSFIQVVSLSLLWFAYCLIMFLIWFAAYELKQPLSDLSTLILGTFGSMAAVQSFNFKAYYHSKKKQEEDEANQ